MELRPPNAPLDAFFGAVRRRHPDVDLVVLPPSVPDPPAEPIAEALVAATLDRVASTAKRLPAPVPEAEARMGYGPEDGTVVASVRSGARTEEGVDALVTLRGALEGDGWQVRHLAGEIERVSGRRGDLRVQASYAARTGAFLMEVRSEPMFVGRARAQELVRR